MQTLPADKPVQTNYNRLHDSIRDDIVAGVLKQGARLKIADLASRYGSSPVPVREALQQLQGEGIIIFTPNRGAKVCRIDESFMRNIYEIRELIEPFLIRWFVSHHNEKELAALETIQRSIDECVENDRIDRVHELNVQFHSICYDNHYNDEALAIANRHSSLISAIVVRLTKSRARVHAICREHWAIIEAVRQQDAAKAAVVVADHVRDAGQHLIEKMRVESVIKMRAGYS